MINDFSLNLFQNKTIVLNKEIKVNFNNLSLM